MQVKFDKTITDLYGTMESLRGRDAKIKPPDHTYKSMNQVRNI